MKNHNLPPSLRQRRFQALKVFALIVLSCLFISEARAQKKNARPTGSLKVVTGQPLSYVYINNVLHGATDQKGELNLSRVWAGSYPVLVRTAGFTDWSGRVVVARGAARTLKVNQQQTTDQALIHYQKGEQLRYRGKSRDAVQEYKQALDLRADFPQAHIGLARSLTGLQDFQGAEQHAQAAIKIGGRTLAEAQTVLANLRRNQGLVEESIEEYKKALRLARNISPEAHVGLAIALNEAGDADEAVRAYRIGIEQDMDTEPILYYQLAEILEKANRYKEAIAAYQNYLRLDPEGEYASAVESIIERLKEELTTKE